jgi:hypothetical protein
MMPSGKNRLPDGRPNRKRTLSVFRYLAKKGNILVADRPIALKAGGQKKTQIVTAEEIANWYAADLIEKCDEGYILSMAGRAWLKRQLASGDAFQEQHQQRTARQINLDGRLQTVTVNDNESPLAWLARRQDKNGKPMLEPFQFEAGERLRADYQFAGLSAKVTANWDPAAAGNPNNQNDMGMLQDNILAARQRVVRAMAAVGPELSGVLVDVCCHLRGLEEAEKAEGWPQRSGKVVLQLALSRLARHYGFISDTTSTERLRRKLQHWGTTDYRPVANTGG